MNEGLILIVRSQSEENNKKLIGNRHPSAFWTKFIPFERRI